MIDRITLLKRKAIGKEYLNQYIKELNLICNKKITPDSLLSIEATYDYIENISRVRKLSHYKSKPFNFHNKGIIKKIFTDLINKKNGELVLITKYSEYCGCLPLEGLQDFNLDFTFAAERFGIITLILKDLSNELILDFWNESDEKILEVEAYGNEWGVINFEFDP